MARTYQQIIKFLEELDRLLTAKFDLYIIGGGSITLFYDHQNRTVDIDAVEVGKEIITIAGKKSALAQKHKVYIQKVSEIGFSSPKDWRNKAKAVESLKLKNLKIFVADIHDVVLGKFARLEPRDRKDISDLYNKGLIDVVYLLQRLNQNKKELMKQKYKNNAKLAFEEIFNKKLIFQQGKAKIG